MQSHEFQHLKKKKNFLMSKQVIEKKTYYLFKFFFKFVSEFVLFSIGK